MGYREERELARIRTELRQRLFAERTGDAAALLQRFRDLAGLAGSPELDSEYERWRVRFEHISLAA